MRDREKLGDLEEINRPRKDKEKSVKLQSINEAPSQKGEISHTRR